LVFGCLTSFHASGLVPMAFMGGLARLGELLGLWLGFGLARRYGGSPRAGWGALLGGPVGAVVGVPVPVVGSVIGAILGCFAGATIFEYATTRTAGTAVRAGWGAPLGRVAASAAKVALGIVMTIVAIVAALRGRAESPTRTPCSGRCRAAPGRPRPRASRSGGVGV